jgi:type I restriction-modification system DNA methylase subunit
MDFHRIGHFRLLNAKFRTVAACSGEFLPCIGNNKKKVTRATYKLNELLHKNDIDEDLRSQFVGTCLLALKNRMFVARCGMSTNQIIAGIWNVLRELLTDSKNMRLKLQILSEKVLENQKIRNLSSENFLGILEFIRIEILPHINSESGTGQDLLSLFFTTFNKYVGKKDKNQAYTPDHIAHFMCKVANISRNSILLDPTCGSGAFLVQAMIRALNDCQTDGERLEVKERHIFGIEKEEQAFGLATTNMLIHGDGNSNIVLANCFNKREWVSNLGINTILMNPPYNATPVNIPKEIRGKWRPDLKDDPTKGFCFVNYAASLIQKGGKLLCLLPLSAAIGSSKEIAEQKEKMLECNTLDAVFTLPSEIFHPSASVNTCCMAFTIGTPHAVADRETFLGYFKDDGLVRRKNLGRIDERNSWQAIEKKWLDLYENPRDVPGLSVVKKITANDEWLAEAYMKTDYSRLGNADFQKALNNYLAYLLSNGKVLFRKDISLNSNDNACARLENIKNWEMFRLGDYFHMEKGKCADSTELIDGHEIAYIGAKKTENGVVKYVKRDGELVSRGNCLCFICQGQGSNGYNNYFEDDTIQTTSNYLGYNDNLDKYVGLFIVTILDLERFRFSFGRGRSMTLDDTMMRLPRAANGSPDWNAMRRFVQSLCNAEWI